MEQIEKKEFVPTGQQAKFARLYIQVPRKTQAQIASEIGVHRNTVTNWLQRKEFREWLNAQYKEMIQENILDLITVGIEKARKGKFDFWKVMMEVAGVYKPGMVIDTENFEPPVIQIIQAQHQTQKGGDNK